MRWWLCLTLACSACASPPALSHAAASPDALARAVLSALARGDASKLRALAITEDEFRALVWPRLPAARPERNVPLSHVWGDLRQKSDASLSSHLARQRGRRFNLVAVRFDGNTTDHADYRIHRKTVLVVRDDDQSTELRLLGSMIERNGQWKVFSYVSGD